MANPAAIKGSSPQVMISACGMVKLAYGGSQARLLSAPGLEQIDVAKNRRRMYKQGFLFNLLHFDLA
jgi:hypothetical protein